MATANPLSITNSPAPSGGAVHVTASFQVAPQITANIQLFEQGVQRQAAQGVVLAEAQPDPVVGNTNVGWEIRTDQGVLRRTGPGTYDLTRT